MRLIDADELKKYAIPCEIHNGALTDLCVPLYQVDNAPTVEQLVGNSDRLPMPQGECKTCTHRDPEDKKCDCGALERQGCPFPVSDDYFCKFYERCDE